MKTISISFVGFYSDSDYRKSQLFKSMARQFDVQVIDNPEKADYIICGVFGKKYEYCKYPQVRIMYEGENYIPDFNLIDYGIFNYPLTFLDRSLYFPFCIDEFDHCKTLVSKSRDYPENILKEKPYFCNFICGHESEYNIRGEFFKALCKYKRVESPGRYLNNMPDGTIVNWDDDTKREFQNKCKFTLCFESTKHNGFVTEKITDAFYADTVPIYYGSDTVKDIFNPKAFIDFSDFNSTDEAIEYIRMIDENDDMYMEMLRQPIFNDKDFYEKSIRQLDEFVYYIFSQPLESVKRRSEVYSAKGANEYLKHARLPLSYFFQQRIIRIKSIIHHKYHQIRKG